jgi:hypothetical protein
MKHNFKLMAGVAALLAYVFYLLPSAYFGGMTAVGAYFNRSHDGARDTAANLSRRTSEAGARSGFFGGGEQRQSNANSNQSGSRKQKPGIFAVIIRLVFGRNASGKSMLRILNQGESPATRATRGVRYDIGTKKIHDLGSPLGARSILLRMQAREAFYLLDGKLFRSELSEILTFRGQPRHLPLEKQTLLSSLIGFVADEPSELLALSRDNSLVRVSAANGKVVTVEAKLSAADVWEVSQQSVAPDGAVATIDSPQQGVWNIMIFPEGENSLGAEIVEAAGVKLDPRWSDDGTNLVFAQEQPEKERPSKQQP